MDDAGDGQQRAALLGPLPDFSLRLDDSDAHLHIQYTKLQPQAFTATIFAPAMPRERQAELNAELALRQAETDDGEWTPGADQDRTKRLPSAIEYPVFTLFTEMREWVASRPLATATLSDPPPRQLKPTEPPRLCLKEVLIWSHHLLATGKRKSIIQWATELEIWGISKPGSVFACDAFNADASLTGAHGSVRYPGLVFLEGISESVDEFVYRIKVRRSFSAFRHWYVLL